MITPAGHRELAREILSSGGCLCSEHGSAPITRSSFVLRDHVQAQLSAGTLVIATSIGGGTLHATRESLALGRPTGIVCPPASEAHEPGYQGSALIVQAVRAGDTPGLAAALGMPLAQMRGVAGALRIIEGPQSLQGFLGAVISSWEGLRRE